MRSDENAVRSFWLTNLLNQPGFQDGWVGIMGRATPGSLHIVQYEMLAEIGLTVHAAVLVLRIKDEEAIICPVFMLGTGLVKMCENDRWIGIHQEDSVQYAHGGLLQIRANWTASIPVRKLGPSICRIKLTNLFNRLIDNEKLTEQITLDWPNSIPSRNMSREMWRLLVAQIKQRPALRSWLTICSDEPPFVPLFGEHNMNKSPEETGCPKAGLNGLVCCCKRICLLAEGKSEVGSEFVNGGETTPTEERFFVCGIVRVERSWSNQGDVGHYHGINSSGGKHHLGEMSSGFWKSKQLCRVHDRRRLAKH